MDEMIRMMQMGGPLMYAVLLLALFVPVTALAMGIASSFRLWLPALAFLAAIGPAVLSFMRGSPTGIVIAVAVLGAGACLAIAGLRIGREPADRRRGAAMRVQVALYGMLAVASLTGGMVLHGRTQAFDALSHASPDMLAALMRMSLEQSELALGGGLIAVVGMFIASLPVVVPQLRHASGLRSLAGAALALSALVVVAALGGVGQWQQDRAMSITSMMRALSASDRAGALPTPGRESPAITAFDRILVHGVAGWERVDESDLPYHAGDHDPTDPLLVVDPGVRARSLVQFDGMGGDLTGFHVLTREAGSVVGEEDDLLRTQRLGTADFLCHAGEAVEESRSEWDHGYGSQSGPTPTNSVFVVDGTSHTRAGAWGMTASAEAVWLVGRSVEPAALGDPEAATEVLRATLEGTGVEYAVFVPGDTWSVQDLVDLCHALGESSVDWSGTRSGIGCGIAADLPAPR